MDIVEVTMNPVRQRIIQYLMIHETATVKDMRNKLNDIPTASLYRHVKVLADHGVIEVVQENRIRGTVESVYQLSPQALYIEDKDGLTSQMVLMNICSSFAKYFATGHADPQKDMYLLTSGTLMLTDEEFTVLLKEINELATKYMSKEPSKGSRQRQLTLISSPCE